MSRFRMTVKELTEMAAKRGLVVWCANGDHWKHSKYIGNVTIAKLKDGAPRRARACENRLRGEIADERFLTAWKGLISANRKAERFIEELEVER